MNKMPNSRLTVSKVFYKVNLIKTFQQPRRFIQAFEQWLSQHEGLFWKQRIGEDEHS